MRIVIQRVSEASVTVEGKIVGQIKQGVVLLVCVMRGDTEETVNFLAQKVVEYRIFSDENHKMNRSLLDVRGEALVISQFTLAADGNKGRRPSFDQAAPPNEAIPLYEKFVQKLRGWIRTETGVFGAHMSVNIVNDGPVTFVLEHPQIPKN